MGLEKKEDRMINEWEFCELVVRSSARGPLFMDNYLRLSMEVAGWGGDGGPSLKLVFNWTTYPLLSAPCVTLIYTQSPSHNFLSFFLLLLSPLKGSKWRTKMTQENLHEKIAIKVLKIRLLGTFILGPLHEKLVTQYSLYYSLFIKHEKSVTKMCCPSCIFM